MDLENSFVWPTFPHYKNNRFLFKNLFLLLVPHYVQKPISFFFFFLLLLHYKNCDGLVMGRDLGDQYNPSWHPYNYSHLIPPPLHLENSQQNSSCYANGHCLSETNKERVQKQRTKHTEQGS